jgi:hypothetical protein
MLLLLLLLEPVPACTVAAAGCSAAAAADHAEATTECCQGVSHSIGLLHQQHGVSATVAAAAGVCASWLWAKGAAAAAAQ